MRKEIKGLKNKSEMQTVFTDFRFLHGCWICCIKDSFVLDADHTIVRLFQEIQAAQKAAAGAAEEAESDEEVIDIEAKPEILQYFYQVGVGGHSSMGYGLLQIIQQI